MRFFFIFIFKLCFIADTLSRCLDWALSLLFFYYLVLLQMIFLHLVYVADEVRASFFLGPMTNEFSQVYLIGSQLVVTVTKIMDDFRDTWLALFFLFKRTLFEI